MGHNRQLNYDSSVIELVADEGSRMTFAEKLKELREQAGLSEAKLAKASGIAFGTVHSYATRSRNPSFTAILKLSSALGVTCEAFAECSDFIRPRKRRKPKRENE